MSEPSQSPDLWAVVAPACAAASVGALAAALASVRQLNPDLRMRWDGFSACAGLAGAASAWLLCRGFWRLGRGALSGAAQRQLRLRVLAGLAALGALLLLTFGLAVAGLPASLRSDMFLGGGLALLVLGTVAWVIRRLALLFGAPEDSADFED